MHISRFKSRVLVTFNRDYHTTELSNYLQLMAKECCVIGGITAELDPENGLITFFANFETREHAILFKAISDHMLPSRIANAV